MTFGGKAGARKRPRAAAVAAVAEGGKNMTAMLDLDYLRDLRDGIGDDALGELIARAPHSFADALAQLRLAWHVGDGDGIEDHAHRLKGAAASIGCRHLADAALAVMVGRTMDAQTIAGLEEIAHRSVAALAAYLAEPG